MTLNLLLLIAGLIICFGGIYIRRLCSAILGLVWGALCTFLLILVNVGLWGFDEDYFVIVVIFALIFAVVSAIYEKLCVVINAFLSTFFLMMMLLLASRELELSAIILLAIVIAAVISAICAKIYLYAYVIMTAFSGGFIANIGGYGLKHDYETAQVLMGLLANEDVRSTILVGTLILGVLGCIVQWNRLKKRVAPGASEGKADTSAFGGTVTPPAERQAVQSPLVREIKKHWGLLLAPWLVEIAWNRWGGRLLHRLFPSMYDYVFEPQTLWQYMPSFIACMLTGWVMASFIMAIKRRTRGFCVIWTIPYMLLALSYLIDMIRCIVEYPGPVWMFSMSDTVYALLPFLFWWIIRGLERVAGAFSDQSVRSYVLCGACACTLKTVIGRISNFILNHSIPYDGRYTPVGISLLRLCLEIAVMAVIIRACFRRSVPSGASAADPAVDRRDD